MVLLLAPIPGRILRHAIQFRECTGVDVYQSPKYVAHDVYRVAVQPTVEVHKTRDNTDVNLKGICYIDARRSTAANPVKWMEDSERAGHSAKLDFAMQEYTVSGVETLYDDTGHIHHWEVLLS